MCKGSAAASCSLLPIFDLVCSLHIINVHTDLIVDFGRQVGAVAMGDVRKHNPSPELLVVQKSHGFIDQSLLVSYWLQLVQIHTLKAKNLWVSQSSL